MFFLFKFNLKKRKIDFSTFGKILVLANVVSSQILIEKKYFFRFWQDLGFGECFFIQILI